MLGDHAASAAACWHIEAELPTSCVILHGNGMVGWLAIFRLVVSVKWYKWIALASSQCNQSFRYGGDAQAVCVL